MNTMSDINHTRTAPFSLMAFASPARFMAFADAVLPWLIAVTAVAMIAAIWMGVQAPADYQQGETVRIMFVHVPSAWLAMGFYVLMSLSAVGTLVWRHPMADVSQKTAAPIGAAFAFLCLITGALWGRPMWGTYWVWDARLTSMLVLFLVYCGIMALWRAIEDQSRAARVVAILTLVGFVNVPIVKFSVDWWNTLHQPASVFRFGGPSIHPSILWPLLVAAIAVSLFAFTLHMAGMRTEILSRRARARALRAAQRHDRANGG
jgi:heme exporter protein C